MRRSEQEAVFRAWLGAHQGILVHIARGFAAAQDRDDLVQEMMLAIWHAIPAFKGRSSPATFIYRVAENAALTWHRRAARQPPLQPLDERTDAAQPVSAKVERSDALYRAIRRLEELDRALVLLYLDQVPYRQIADVLGLSESNVGVRLHRIRKRLARLIEEEPR